MSDGQREPAPPQAATGRTSASAWGSARRLLLILFLLVALALAAYLAFKRWHKEPMPPPPAVAVEGLDPELSEAIQAARDRILREPYSAEAWGYLGKLLRLPNFNEEASFCFAQAEKLEPQNVRWPYLRGEAFELENPEKSLPHLRRAAELADRAEPDNIVPRLRLAGVLQGLGLFDEAAANLRRAREIDPDNPNVAFYAGLLAVAQENPEEARKAFLRCQYAESTRQKACQQLAALYARLGKSDEAARYLQKATELPKDVNWSDPYVMDYHLLAVGKQVRFRYIDRLETQGKYQEAVEKLQEMLAEGPDYRAYIGLGKDLGQLGDLDGAERALREAVRMAPGNSKAYYYLSRVHLLRGEQLLKQPGSKEKADEQFRAAVEDARKSLAGKADNAMAHLHLGLALKHLGQLPEALSAFREAVECAPETAETHYELALALDEAGQHEQARRHFEQVLRLTGAEDARHKAAKERLEKKPGTGF